MLFNSITYLVFLPIAVFAYWRVEASQRLCLILVASCVFYGFWRIEFLPLLLFSAFMDYFLAIWIDRTRNERRRYRLLLVSIAVNLSILFSFKYFLFLRSSIFSLAEMLGYKASFIETSLILPLGISFYIFATISYVIDVYRREYPAERDLLHYTCFVVYFPHLVAGPILRARSLIPQLRYPAEFKLDLVPSGVARITAGLFLKVVLADPVGVLVDQAFARDPATLTGLDCWTMAFLFGCQIYFDFSGYSHIAIGSSLLMGVRLPENFNFPYVASSPREFWRRWHISLSTWIRDYVYLPLVGDYRSESASSVGTSAPRPGIPKEQRTIPLFTTWALMGLWHGANWTFVVWGLYHAAAVWGHRKLAAMFEHWRVSVPSLLAWAVTLAVMMGGWIPFRSQTLSATFTMWSSMVNPAKLMGLTLLPVCYVTAAALFALMPAAYYAEKLASTMDQSRWRIHLVAGWVYYSAAFFAIIVFLRVTSQFIYFQF
jgi:alginate O-acetyltransferase complex protein AlgI